MSRARQRFGFEILGVLALKAALLTALYYACFGPSHQTRVDSQQLDRHLFSSAPADDSR